MLQNKATPPSQDTIPTVFTDSLSQRARLARYNGVGNPFYFLNVIGLIPIKERIFKGATLLEVAEELNLPLTALHRWIENEGHEAEIEQAEIESAEGYIVEGQRMVRNAQNKFDLDKGRQMIEHGRWMASKKDKKTYGNTVGELGQGAQVSYVFNIGDGSNVQINNRQQEPDKPVAPVPADHPTLAPAQPKHLTFNLHPIDPNELPLDRPPAHLQKPHSNYEAIAPIEMPGDGL